MSDLISENYGSEVAEAMRVTPTCSACGGTEHLRFSQFHGDHQICRPCFMVWYDPDENIDNTDPKQVGALSLKLKAAGKFPWSGQYAPSLAGGSKAEPR